MKPNQNKTEDIQSDKKSPQTFGNEPEVKEPKAPREPSEYEVDDE